MAFPVAYQTLQKLIQTGEGHAHDPGRQKIAISHGQIQGDVVSKNQETVYQMKLLLC
jgi:hypothetical protein